jgi:SP family general alpha glucoside:H+ symporter-like MFS transporter
MILVVSQSAINGGNLMVVLGNLIGVPKYRERYGYWTGEENGYQLTPAWQTAVGQASTIGCFL